MSAKASIGRVAGVCAVSVVAMMAATGGAWAATVTVDLDKSLDNFGVIGGSVYAYGVYGPYDVATIHNERSGRISGYEIGVLINGTTDVFINDGTVSGDFLGTFFFGSAGDVTNTGAITGQTGVELYSGLTGTFRNASGGSIAGTNDGIDAAQHVATFINEAGASITGEYALRISNGGIGSFTNAGTMTGSTSGVLITGDADSFLNSGSITGSGSVAVEIAGGVSGSFVNAVGGTILGSGSNAAVSISHQVATFTNAGSIRSTGGNAISLGSAGGNVTSFTNSGTIVSDQHTGVEFFHDVGSITNTGQISGLNEYGILAHGSFDTFVNSGTIEGGAPGPGCRRRLQLWRLRLVHELRRDPNDGQPRI